MPRTTLLVLQPPAVVPLALASGLRHSHCSPSGRLINPGPYLAWASKPSNRCPHPPTCSCRALPAPRRRRGRLLEELLERSSGSGSVGHTFNFILQQDYRSTYLAQNILPMPRDDSVGTLMDTWLSELPPDDLRRQNLLNPDFVQMGAGWGGGIMVLNLGGVDTS